VSKPIDFVQTYPPLGRLGEAELQKLEAHLETSRFAKGEAILRRTGEPSQYLYLVHRGEVRLEREGQTVMILETGDPFGYISVLSQNPPSFDVIAGEETELLQVPGEVFRQLLRHPGFAGYFFKGLNEGLPEPSSLEVQSLSGDLAGPVEKLIAGPPMFVSPEASVAETAQKMSQAHISSVLVSTDPPGIITDRDLRSRVLAEGLGPDTPAHQVMSRPFRSLPAETPVYGALLFMLEENVHHLPLHREGQIVGVVTDTDLLRHQAKSPLYLLKQVEQLEKAEALARYSLEVAGMVEALFRGGLDVAQIGRIVASLNDALIKRLLRLAEREFGPPPTPYAWIVFGSEGRMEQALLTDQDNALIYLRDSPEARQYFAAFSQRVVGGLIKAGFPSCPGGYMATQWHKPLDEWLRLFKGWIETPRPQALLEATIFFDFRPVYGNLLLDSLDELLFEAGDWALFLAHLARAALEFRPPLGGFFKRIQDDKEGRVDFKLGGIAPIVSLARLYALEAHAGQARSTFERLKIAARSKSLSRTGADTLAETFRLLLRLRLREQLDTMKAGGVPDNKVYLSHLSPLEQRHLKEAFLAIREMQEATASNFRTNMLG
jgi:CBS domain-containing protein